MSDSINILIKDVSNTKSLKTIQAICSRLCNKLGFDYFIYTCILPTSFAKPEISYLDNHPLWVKHYISKNYISIDPIAAYCMNSTTPIDWNELTIETNKTITSFIADREKHGLVSGISFPLHTPHGVKTTFSLVTQSEYQSAKKIIDKARYIGPLFQAHMTETALRTTKKNLLNKTISEREKACLFWAAEGKTAWETAQILKISESTVNFHINNVIDKLGTINRQHAVARSISTGLITQTLNKI